MRKTLRHDSPSRSATFVHARLSRTFAKCAKMASPRRASTLSNAVSSLASTGMSFTKVDEREKQAALEEEQARLKALKVTPVVRNRSSRLRRPSQLRPTCCFPSGAAAEGALQEALLLHHRYVAHLHHRGHYQHSTRHRSVLDAQLLQWVRASLICLIGILRLSCSRRFEFAIEMIELEVEASTCCFTLFVFIDHTLP